MSAATPRSSYLAAAIVLHWAIAFAIALMIPLGWWMADAIHDPGTQSQAVAAFQLHKSIGLSILALSVARLGVRLAAPPPPLAASMKAWERTAASAAHWGLYGLMILIPLSGWVYVSTGFTQDGRPLAVPTLFFGLFEVPHLPIAAADDGARKAAAAGSMSAHSALAWAMIVLAGLHVAAALKHQFADRDGVLGRMIPGLPAPDAPTTTDPRRRMALIAGFALIAAAAIGIGAALATLPKPGPAIAQTEDGDAPAAIEAVTPTPEPAEATENASAAAGGAAQVAAATKPAPGGPAPASTPPSWQIDAAQSAITFSGTHAGAAFEGRFTRWRADIVFSPEALAQSRAVVTIETASADAGDPVRNSTLPQAEWFDAKAFPTATFEATAFRAVGPGRFEAQGALSIKGKRSPATLSFTFAETRGVADVSGRVTLDRVALGLGLSSDPGAQWVSRDIDVRIRVRATRGPA